ncbi:MAG: DNA-binding protein WhiA [Lachnospiraceae bacterium]|nr:DNA-binding protein WhiA [Lachnospiraceae bacterium]
MSFSSQVKMELQAAVPKDTHCLRAELWAFLASGMPERPEEKMYEKTCCKRAFLRGIFLRNGTMTDPNEIYNLEMVFRYSWLANEVMRLLVQFEIPGKITERKGRYVVYLRDGDDISDFLKVLGANASLLQMEDIRVVKDVRNRVNRRVNCETANIHKTAATSVRQIEDIRTIEEREGLDSLPEPLREIALARLEYPEATLSELGDLLDPPVGKSGVNHRLRRLHEIAVGKETET